MPQAVAGIAREGLSSCPSSAVWFCCVLCCCVALLRPVLQDSDFGVSAQRSSTSIHTHQRAALQLGTCTHQVFIALARSTDADSLYLSPAARLFVQLVDLLLQKNNVLTASACSL